MTAMEGSRLDRDRSAWPTIVAGVGVLVGVAILVGLVLVVDLLALPSVLVAVMALTLADRAASRNRVGSERVGHHPSRAHDPSGVTTRCSRRGSGPDGDRRVADRISGSLQASTIGSSISWTCSDRPRRNNASRRS